MPVSMRATRMKATQTTALVVCGVAFLGGYAVFSPPSSSGVREDRPSVSATPVPSSLGPKDQVGGEFYEGVPEVTWEPGTDADVEGIATEVMGLFARPGAPERRWYTDLLPYLSEDYAEAAGYIDPANVRISSIVSGPVLVREQNNPLTVSAQFSTDAGPWTVLLHRVGQDEPWLVEAIEPTTTSTESTIELTDP
ncbi:hypothetical protein FQ377_13820 [Arthrobacter echini]|uniref:Uncharacterized protein n=1 Tax=Arthrobacter echini TaxID=1529066 RepID=A0A5D0XJG7_9MICC|nr:hypothetical protein [Arthrobacter echini]TYC96600.1 hypothetical protein FQ377_13820 [Arthrobacter echini]